MTTFDHRSWMFFASWLVLELHAHCTGFPQSVHMPKHQQFQRVVGQTLTRDQIYAASHFSLWWNSDWVLHSSHRRTLQFWVLHPSKKRGLEHLEPLHGDPLAVFHGLDASMRRCQANGGFGAAQTAKTYLSHTTRRHSLTPQLANSKHFFFWSGRNM